MATGKHEYTKHRQENTKYEYMKKAHNMSSRKKHTILVDKTTPKISI